MLSHESDVCRNGSKEGLLTWNLEAGWQCVQLSLSAILKKKKKEIGVGLTNAFPVKLAFVFIIGKLHQGRKG